VAKANPNFSNKFEFYTPYHNQKKVKPFNTVGESMTQEQFAAESEINNIIRSHDRNGVIEHINRGNAIYADFSNITDFSDALEQIREAQNEFQQIPSEIREKFQNDAGNFFKFASNPDNIEELRELGLAEPKRPDAMPSEPAIPEAVEPKNSKAQE
jgi:phage internal scaffolding protein